MWRGRPLDRCRCTARPPLPRTPALASTRRVWLAPVKASRLPFCLPLQGLTAVVKDCFAVAGTHCSNGSPAWLATHAAAERHAAAVQVGRRRRRERAHMAPVLHARQNRCQHAARCLHCCSLHGRSAWPCRRCWMQGRLWLARTSWTKWRVKPASALLAAVARLGTAVQLHGHLPVCASSASSPSRCAPCAMQAYSLAGENAHYGTPTNPAAPERTPGGSSSGTAAAVAAGDANIGLGAPEEAPGG